MKSPLEVCQWLVMERPDILIMAYQMYSAKNTSLDSPPINMSNMPATVTQMKKSPHEEKSLARLWLEEIKCLFLRCRKPSDTVIESLIEKIFNYDLCSDDASEIICHSKRTLTDYRNKLNNKIVKNVNKLKEIRLREGQRNTPTGLEIEEFISQEVVEEILKNYLKGTNKRKLKQCGTMDQLILFVREAFKVHYAIYDTKAIIRLNYITLDCKVPSRSGKNIASKLSLVN